MCIEIIAASTVRTSVTAAKSHVLQLESKHKNSAASSESDSSDESFRLEFWRLQWQIDPWPQCSMKFLWFFINATWLADMVPFFDCNLMVEDFQCFLDAFPRMNHVPWTTLAFCAPKLPEICNWSKFRQTWVYSVCWPLALSRAKNTRPFSCARSTFLLEAPSVCVSAWQESDCEFSLWWSADWSQTRRLWQRLLPEWGRIPSALPPSPVKQSRHTMNKRISGNCAQWGSPVRLCPSVNLSWAVWMYLSSSLLAEPPPFLFELGCFTNLVNFRPRGLRKIMYMLSVAKPPPPPPYFCWQVCSMFNCQLDWRHQRGNNNS